MKSDEKEPIMPKEELLAYGRNEKKDFMKCFGDWPYSIKFHYTALLLISKILE